jgi:hypothetical protein
MEVAPAEAAKEADPMIAMSVLRVLLIFMVWAEFF